MKNFGETVRKYRLEKGMSQQELAEKMHYKTRASISAIEKGINDIPLSTVEHLAACLGVTPGTLMGWEEKYVDDAEEPLTSTEKRLLTYFRALNPKGQILAMKDIENISDAFSE